jgi:hypothetical protein
VVGGGNSPASTSASWSSAFSTRAAAVAAAVVKLRNAHLPPIPHLSHRCYHQWLRRRRRWRRLQACHDGLVHHTRNGGLVLLALEHLHTGYVVAVRDANLPQATHRARGCLRVNPMHAPGVPRRPVVQQPQNAARTHAFRLHGWDARHARTHACIRLHRWGTGEYTGTRACMHSVTRVGYYSTQHACIRLHGWGYSELRRCACLGRIV